MNGFGLIYKEFQQFDWSNTHRICAEKCHRDSPAVLYGSLSPAVMVTRGHGAIALSFFLFLVLIYTQEFHTVLNSI